MRLSRTSPKVTRRASKRALDAIAPLDDALELVIRNQDAARNAIFNLYENDIHQAFDPPSQKYDYVSAIGIVAKLDALYPDSAQVLTVRGSLEDIRVATLSELAEQYKSHVDEGRLITDHKGEDIGDVLKIVRAIDPKHRLLQDQNLPFAFEKLAEQAIQDKNYDRARNVLLASQAYAPDDKRLKDLDYQVRTELQRLANEKRVVEIQARLEGQLASLKSLDDFQRVRDDLIVLSDLSPANPVLARIRTSLQTAFAGALGARIKDKQWPEAEGLLFSFAKLFNIPYLTQQRVTLSNAESKANFDAPANAQGADQILSRSATVAALLKKPEFTSDWEIKLKVPYKELIALLPLGDPRLEPVRDATAKLYLERASAARLAGSFTEALAFVEKGRGFYPGLKNFSDEVAAIDIAKEAERRERVRQERLARIASLKIEFEEKASLNDINAAKVVLEQLGQEKLEADDDFLTTKAPGMLSDAYSRHASNLADAGKFDDALTFAKAALNLTPDREPLTKTVAVFQAEVVKRKLQLDLARLFDSVKPLAVADVKRDLTKLKKNFPNEYSTLSKKFSASRRSRIVAQADSKGADLSKVAKRLDELKAVFPAAYKSAHTDVVASVKKQLSAAPRRTAKDVAALQSPLAGFKSISAQDHAALSKLIGDAVAKTVKVLKPTDQGAARDLLLAGVSAVPSSTTLAKMKPIEAPPPKEIESARQLVKQGGLTKATAQLSIAKKKVGNHSSIPPVEQALTSAKQAAESAYAEYAKLASASIKTSGQRAFDAKLESIRRKWSDRSPKFKRIAVKGLSKGECHASLAGYGKKRVCYDQVAKRKGPVLIVVPIGGSVAKPFAISKYEVTVADYNHFCKKSKQCKAKRKGTRVPMTNISLSQAETYLQWLSDEASKKGQKVIYRLPTNEEWEHAASAAGAQPPKEYNCTVIGTSGQKVAGHALVDAKAGAANGWGLTNYVGNAQEWAKSGNGVVARGGTFEDPLDKCDLSISRAHSGRADSTTGFRVVRELG